MRRRGRLLRIALIVLPITVALAGCETFDKLNPFAEKETPLPGARKPLFPEGVPGVEFGAAPPQPSNSNIPIPSSIGDGSAEQGQVEQQPLESTANPQPVQPSAPTSAKSKQSDSDDAWTGTR